jgi:Flp pilus assembly protein TadG
MRRRFQRPADRRGAATVEFAVVAPVFLLFVVGIVEFGRALMVQQLLTNAAREGARVGVLDNSQTGDVTSAVSNYLAGGGVSGATTTVTPSPPSSAAYGSPVTVTITVPYSSVSWVPSPWFLQNTTLGSTCVMRRETSQ